jgi:hypothetical protein
MNNEIIHAKLETFLQKIFQKLPKIEANFTNFEVCSSKTELPKIEITNIEHCWLERIDNSKTSAELYESNF